MAWLSANLEGNKVYMMDLIHNELDDSYRIQLLNDNNITDDFNREALAHAIEVDFLC